jgi:hypothetical protein
MIDQKRKLGRTVIAPVAGSKVAVLGRWPWTGAGTRGSAFVGSTTWYRPAGPVIELTAVLIAWTVPLTGPVLQLIAWPGCVGNVAPSGPTAIAASVTPTTTTVTAIRSARRR